MSPITTEADGLQLYLNGTPVADLRVSGTEEKAGALFGAAGEMLAQLKGLQDLACSCEGPNEATNFEGYICPLCALIAKAEGRS